MCAQWRLLRGRCFHILYDPLFQVQIQIQLHPSPFFSYFFSDGTEEGVEILAEYSTVIAQ